jgi:hypothetical protein
MKKVTHISFFTLASKLVGFFKIAFLVGSEYALFSPASALVPLSGAFGGGIVSAGLFVMRLALQMIFGGLYLGKGLAFCVPGFFASLYWAYDTVACRVMVPVVCIVLFVLNPTVGYAAPYALLWTIPMICYFIPSRNPFFTALGSTFVGHGVGSVIWLYTVPMTPLLWLGLIPIVFVERLVCAVAMTALYYVFQFFSSYTFAPQSLALRKPLII